MKKLLEKLNKNKIIYIESADFKDISYINLQHDISLLIKPDSVKKLIITIKLLNQFKMSYAFISKATNSYLIDNKIVLISLMNLKKRNYKIGDKIWVSGNQTMAFLARYYAKKNIKSFLGGTLIPGSIGAGVLGNAGLKNITITKYLKKIIVLNLDNLKVEMIPKEKINFSYRSSNIKNKIILFLEFKKASDIKSMDFYKYLAQYRSNQPKLKSLGSTFKNSSLCKAGKLLDNLGLKGVKYKNFEISSEHANFIVVNGEVKSEDLYMFILLIQIWVYVKCKIVLEPEITRLKKYPKTK